MLRKLYRKITGKRSAVDEFLDRAWTVRVAPANNDEAVNFNGKTGVITVDANLPDAMRRDIMAVLTANPVSSDKHTVDAEGTSRIQRLLVKRR